MGLVRDLKKGKKGDLERGCLSGLVVVFVIMGCQLGVEKGHMVSGGCRVERGNEKWWVESVPELRRSKNGPSPAMGAWE